MNVEVFPAITDDGEKDATVMLGAATIVRLAESVVPVPSTLYALMVQVPVPVALAETVRLPEVLELEPLAPPEQTTLTVLAFAVVQENVLVSPTPPVTIVGENDLAVIVACV